MVTKKQNLKATNFSTNHIISTKDRSAIFSVLSLLKRLAFISTSYINRERKNKTHCFLIILLIFPLCSLGRDIT